MNPQQGLDPITVGKSGELMIFLIQENTKALICDYSP